MLYVGARSSIVDVEICGWTVVRRNRSTDWGDCEFGAIAIAPSASVTAREVIKYGMIAIVCRGCDEK